VIIVWYVTEWNEDRSPRELECQLVSSGYESAAVAAHELREHRGINSDTVIDADTFVKLPPSKRIRTQASFARIWRAALQLDSFARLETATPFFAVHQERDNRVELALEMKNPSGRAPDVGKASAPSPRIRFTVAGLSASCSRSTSRGRATRRAPTHAPARRPPGS
jgi:hypothetical protein